MAIVWDERKRLLNVRKHGLDFALVEDAFDFAGALYAAANDDRTKAIGQFEDRLSVLIFQQLGDEAISLVSLRVASKKEREAYANQI
jgi:uncharacterized DUF497 family protein